MYKKSYSEFINQFDIINDISSSEIRKHAHPGVCYHHLVPISWQMKERNITNMPSIKFVYDPRCDRRGVALSMQDHAYAHYLWDREHIGETTFKFFRNTIKANIDWTDYEAVYNTLAELNDRTWQGLVITASQKRSWADPEKRAKRVKAMSDAKTGRVNVCVGTRWMRKGEELRRVKEDLVQVYLDNGWQFSGTRTSKKEG